MSTLLEDLKEYHADLVANEEAYEIAMEQADEGLSGDGQGHDPDMAELFVSRELAKKAGLLYKSMTNDTPENIKKCAAYARGIKTLLTRLEEKEGKTGEDYLIVSNMYNRYLDNLNYRKSKMSYVVIPTLPDVRIMLDNTDDETIFVEQEMPEGTYQVLKQFLIDNKVPFTSRGQKDQVEFSIEFDGDTVEVVWYD